jgi:hypothetical protein
VKIVLRHWDLVASISVAAGALVLLPPWVKASFVISLYEMGISVLSIIFSVFFAALAVIISAGDDKFVMYLRSYGLYDGLLWQFKFTLRLLFLSLVFSIVAFAVTAAAESQQFKYQAIIVFSFFCFLFVYSLFASVLAVGSAMRYAQSRMTYLEMVEREKADQGGESQDRP